jgi:hypothetical protein
MPQTGCVELLVGGPEKGRSDRQRRVYNTISSHSESTGLLGTVGEDKFEARGGTGTRCKMNPAPHSARCLNLTMAHGKLASANTATEERKKTFIQNTSGLSGSTLLEPVAGGALVGELARSSWPAATASASELAPKSML